ncbi:hypothetical protein [Mesorhizobium sp.]|uniref:hypothetical protein n=1 Tax=Mesorhizobium sp. TaxID=1871066 RepID=UPI000FE4CFA1|nr:hypothetical protein [Mesorhizobium sp.]RWJ41564.1 MAG: hypothetical protein EOR31_25740 [Mesorhizobium sp.]
MTPALEIAALGASLDLLKRDYDDATKAGATGWQKRRAAYESLMYIIQFMRAVPGMEGRDFALVSLLAALTDIEAGHMPDWLINTQNGRPPGAPVSIMTLRPRFAAVMEFFMRQGEPRRDAAKRVWRHIPPDMAVRLAGRRGSWQSVAGWRDEWIGISDPERQHERAGFDSTLTEMTRCLAQGMSTDQVASKVFTALQKMKL